MESRHDTENAERILYNMTPQQLVDVCKQAYNQEDIEDENECEVSCRDVAHNIYILAHQVFLGTFTFSNVLICCFSRPFFAIDQLSPCLCN